MKYLFVYLAAINILAFAAMGIDKAKARAGKWRIAEGTLFALAALGGALGGTLGMRVFHHKTKHKEFRFGFPALLCLQCAAVCPRKVIVPVSYDADIVIACSNHERGAYTRRECDMGCVGCHLCEKQCEFDAIHVVNNLAVIDYSKCVSCGRCAAVCPRKLISDSNLRQDMDAVPAMPR